jgi:hypothetical protein
LLLATAAGCSKTDDGSDRGATEKRLASSQKSPSRAARDGLFHYCAAACDTLAPL